MTEINSNYKSDEKTAIVPTNSSCQNEEKEEEKQVPSLQRATFNQFDEIVVGKMLSCLSTSERRRMRLVCSFWKSLIDNKVGLDVTINILNRPLMDWVSRTVLSTIRVKRLTNNGVNENFFRHVHPNTWMLYPKQVQTLTVEQYMNVEFLEEILIKCTNLKHLKIALQNLSANELRDEVWKNRISPYLQTLQIIHQISSSSISSNYELTCKILQIRVPQLKYFSLNFHLNYSTMEIEALINLQMTLIRFLQHHPTIRYAYIDFKGKTTSWSLPNYLVQTYVHQYGFENEDFSKIAKNLRNLHQLVIRLPKTCGFEFWKLLYTQQTKLNKLVIQLGDIKFQSLLPIIQQNSKTLTVLSLCAETDIDYNIIDMSVLFQCQSLKNLHIEVPYKEDRSLAPQIVHFGELPSSIEKLDIGWIVLRTTDTQKIANLPHLKHLALVGCGESDEFGITIPILNELFQNRNLEELFIYNINHHFMQFYMRRLVNILNHLQRHSVRVHIRERAFYMVNNEHSKKSNWAWGTVLANSTNWTRPPATFFNKYTMNEDLSISL